MRNMEQNHCCAKYQERILLYECLRFHILHILQEHYQSTVYVIQNLVHLEVLMLHQQFLFLKTIGSVYHNLCNPILEEGIPKISLVKSTRDVFLCYSLKTDSLVGQKNSL